MFTFQATSSAHVNAPDSAFSTISRHRTKLGAARAYDAARKAMVKRCGGSAWDRNFRVLDADGRELDLFDLAAMVAK
jgi:hypothetical protein